MDIKNVLEAIKNLHLKCGYENYEHLYLLPLRWLFYSNLKQLVRKFMKIYKIRTVRH